MKILSLLIIVFMSFSAFAGERSLTLKTFIKTMSPSHEKALPKRFGNLIVKDLTIHGPRISFKIKNFPIHIELVKNKKTSMKVNGVVFAQKDFESDNVLRKQIKKKFHLYTKRFSLVNLLFPSAQATFFQGNTSMLMAQRLMSLGYNVQMNNQFNRLRTYPDIFSLMSAINAAGNQGSDFMAALMGAANKFQYQAPQEPLIKPFKLRSSKSSN